MPRRAYAVDRRIKRMERGVGQCTAAGSSRSSATRLMAVFHDADSAVQAACEIQQRIDSLPPVSGVKLSIRAGLHCGPAQERNNDVFGDTVDMAARMVALAKGGQIVTTAATVAELSPASAAKRPAPSMRRALRGKTEGVGGIRGDLARQSRADDEDFAVHDGGAAPHAEAAPRWHRCASSTPCAIALGFGRDAGSDLIVADRRASRIHARIERRVNHYVLVDQSTNGTYVDVRRRARDCAEEGRGSAARPRSHRLRAFIARQQRRDRRVRTGRTDGRFRRSRRLGGLTGRRPRRPPNATAPPDRSGATAPREGSRCPTFPEPRTCAVALAGRATPVPVLQGLAGRSTFGTALLGRSPLTGGSAKRPKETRWR
ncbi:MAG: adenylate/guanylate cyclase domain-containing protein [Chromatiales bacterium]|nr:adenylate/guanylate cyclase domain-containing protein [Chromatiales bacterium]